MADFEDNLIRDEEGNPLTDLSMMYEDLDVPDDEIMVIIDGELLPLDAQQQHDREQYRAEVDKTPEQEAAEMENMRAFLAKIRGASDPDPDQGGAES